MACGIIEAMKYENITAARFIERENRFVARVSLPGSGAAVGVHVKNTGRCRELLVPGATVYLEDHGSRMGNRKYRYSLIAVEKAIPAAAEKAIPAAGKKATPGILLINMDSQAPNKVVQEALESGKLRLPGFGSQDGEAAELIVRPESTFGDSRFDFYLEYMPGTAALEYVPGATATECVPEATAYLEVKGVTLEEDGIVRFPDAPTLRGVKHLEELEKAVAAGHRAYILFVIQMEGMKRFEPNDATHPQFGDALRQAKAAGVEVLAVDCLVRPDELVLHRPVEVCLDPAKV